MFLAGTRTKTRKVRRRIPSLGIARTACAGQEGYLLLAVMLVVTIMLIMLAIEAPRIGQQIQREKEEELINRGKEYAGAIRKFYRKNGAYPVSLEQLEDTNHMRFLRKRFKDPMTPEGEWKLIHVGEAQISFPVNPSITGQPGSLTTNPAGGSASPSPSPGGLGGPSGFGTGGLGGPSGLSTGGLGTGAQGTPGQGQGTSGQMGTLATQNIGSATGARGGPIMGVASMSKKTSIREFNGNSEYDQWLFVYEPRLEQIGGGTLIASPRSGNAPPVPGLQPAPAAQPAPSGQLPPQPPPATSPTPGPIQ